MPSMSTSIRFKSERFDYRSELPLDYNAGNRFYGKDVAEFLVEQLNRQGFVADFLDEDWGWLILSAKDTSPQFEVAIYNLAEHGEGGRPGEPDWGLWIRAYEKKKLLGFVPKKTEVQLPPELLGVLNRAISTAGGKPELWVGGPQ